MPVIKNFYDVTTLFPIEVIQIHVGKLINYWIAPEEETPSPKIAKKLIQQSCINGNFKKSNETEPLQAEFDDMFNI